jgi:hypothetical protein
VILQWQLDRAPADSSLLFDTSTFDSAPICVPGSDSGAGTRRPGRVDTNGDAASVDGAAASPLPETEKAAKDCQEATEAVQSIVASRTMGVHEPQLDGLTPAVRLSDPQAASGCSEAPVRERFDVHRYSSCVALYQSDCELCVAI